MNLEEYKLLHLMNKLKESSKCIDKQVVCIITDSKYRILSVGINQVLECNKDCHNKESRICTPIHAEIVAANNLHDIRKTDKAYLNLFPCVPCQKVLGQIGTKEIVVFGPQHKEQWFPNIRLEKNFYVELLDHDTEAKQLSVAQGELAELITAISDFFWRPDKGVPIEELADEILDAELMLDQIKLVAWRKNNNLYDLLTESRAKKYAQLQMKIDHHLI